MTIIKNLEVWLKDESQLKTFVSIHNVEIMFTKLLDGSMINFTITLYSDEVLSVNYCKKTKDTKPDELLEYASYSLSKRADYLEEAAEEIRNGSRF
jgi:hypothetical protein